MRTVLAAGSTLLLVILASGCGEQPHAITCSLPYCADQKINASASQIYVLEVGQSINGAMDYTGVSMSATSSDPTVVRPVGGIKPQSFIGETKPVRLWAAFIAVNPGKARLSFAYDPCNSPPSASCSYHADVIVIQFPKASITFHVAGSGSTAATLRVGQVARFNMAASGGGWSLTHIDDPGATLEWVVPQQPFPHGLLEGAMRAVAPGTARLVAQDCPSADAACGGFCAPDNTCGGYWYLILTTIS